MVFPCISHTPSLFPHVLTCYGAPSTRALGNESPMKVHKNSFSNIFFCSTSHSLKPFPAARSFPPHRTMAWHAIHAQDSIPHWYFKQCNSVMGWEMWSRMKIFNQCASLTQVGDLIPHGKSSMNVIVWGGWGMWWSLIESLQHERPTRGARVWADGAWAYTFGAMFPSNTTVMVSCLTLC